MAGNIMFSDWQGMIWNVPLLGVVIGGALWALFVSANLSPHTNKNEALS
jgi:hypothetical protein